MNATELQAVIAAHARWLTNEPGGKRANLAGANLRRANLAGADLRGADLADANLAEANLAEATVWPGWKVVKA